MIVNSVNYVRKQKKKLISVMSLGVKRIYLAAVGCVCACAYESLGHTHARECARCVLLIIVKDGYVKLMLIMTGLIHKWNKRGEKKIESDDINMGKR